MATREVAAAHTAPRGVAHDDEPDAESRHTRAALPAALLLVHLGAPGVTPLSLHQRRRSAR